MKPCQALNCRHRVENMVKRQYHVLICAVSIAVVVAGGNIAAETLKEKQAKQPPPTALMMHIENRMDYEVEACWNGSNDHCMGFVDPGEKMELNTFVSHAFEIKNTLGNLVDSFTVQPDQKLFTVTGKGYIFSSEPEDNSALSEVQVSIQNQLPYPVYVCADNDRCWTSIGADFEVQLTHSIGEVITFRNGTIGFGVEILLETMVNHPNTKEEDAVQVVHINNSTIQSRQLVTNVEVKVRFYNNMRHPIKPCWNGDKCNYGEILPGGLMLQNTFAGHTFAFKGGDKGDTLEVITICPGITGYTIDEMSSRRWRWRGSLYTQRLAAHKKQYSTSGLGSVRIPIRNKQGVATNYTHKWVNTLRGPAKHYIHTAKLPVEIFSSQGHFKSVSPPAANKCWRPQYKADVTSPKLIQSTEPLKIRLEPVSESPRVYKIADFLSHEECDHLRHLAIQGDRMFVSMTGDEANSKVDDTSRRSKQTWLKRGESEIIKAIFQRVFHATNISLEKMDHIAEDLQVVRYEGTFDPQRVGYYSAHHDYFPPVFGRKRSYTYFSRTGTNRMATLLFYLNDVQEGGETVFPLVNVSVSLPKGSAILFYSMQPDGNLDALSQHEGTPVRKGNKWISNLWLWDERREFSTFES